MHCNWSWVPCAIQQMLCAQASNLCASPTEDGIKNCSSCCQTQVAPQAVLQLGKTVHVFAKSVSSLSAHQWVDMLLSDTASAQATLPCWPLSLAGSLCARAHREILDLGVLGLKLCLQAGRMPRGQRALQLRVGAPCAVQALQVGLQLPAELSRLLYGSAPVYRPCSPGTAVWTATACRAFKCWSKATATC